ncbi:uncharacterized protein LOC109830866 [Asparagus officinalis]|uniref:uncharacterized protein LOC109830866 n=1 Tax=Asparagus officinalis TaxID=4686 RepID=UPI00098DEC52|nr:uncharacterized protein LOC109830866 [Asparagus officinalis]
MFVTNSSPVSISAIDEQSSRVFLRPDVETVARHLAALGFLDPYRKPNKRVPGNRQFSSRSGFGYEEYRAPIVVTNTYLLGNAWNKPVRLIEPQVVDVFDQDLLVRRGALRQSVGSAQFFPYRVNGSGPSCAGTGVFLPRVSNNELRRKPAKMTLVEEQQKQPVSSKMTAKKQQTQLMKPLIQVQPPTELALPQEWTY